MMLKQEKLLFTRISNLVMLTLKFPGVKTRSFFFAAYGNRRLLKIPQVQISKVQDQSGG